MSMPPGYNAVPISEAWLASMPIGGYLVVDTSATVHPFKYASLGNLGPSTFPVSAVAISQSRQRNFTLIFNEGNGKAGTYKVKQ